MFDVVGTKEMQRGALGLLKSSRLEIQTWVSLLRGEEGALCSALVLTGP